MNSFKLIKLPKIVDSRGNLSFLEEVKQIPFLIKRVSWIYDIPAGETLENPTNRKSQELIIALSGSFEIVIDSGLSKNSFSLNRSDYGLYIPSNFDRKIVNFSTNSIALIVASSDYEGGNITL